MYRTKVAVQTTGKLFFRMPAKLLKKVNCTLKVRYKTWGVQFIIKREGLFRAAPDMLSFPFRWKRTWPPFGCRSEIPEEKPTFDPSPIAPYLNGWPPVDTLLSSVAPTKKEEYYSSKRPGFYRAYRS